MGSTYLLIAVVIGFNGGGAASVSVEFSSREACMAALVQFSRQTTTANNIRPGGILFCTPKGNP